MLFSDYVRGMVLIVLGTLAVLSLLGILFHMMGWHKEKLIKANVTVTESDKSVYVSDGKCVYTMEVILILLDRIHTTKAVLALKEEPKFTATPHNGEFACIIGGSMECMDNFLALFPEGMDYCHHRDHEYNRIAYLTMGELEQVVGHLDPLHADFECDELTDDFTMVTRPGLFTRNPTLKHATPSVNYTEHKIT